MNSPKYQEPLGVYYPSRLIQLFFFKRIVWILLWHLFLDDGDDSQVSEEFQAKTRVLFYFIDMKAALGALNFDI